MDFCTFHPHWILFGLSLAFVPRITLAYMLMFTDFESGRILWWSGYIFTPRLLVAFLSLAYWNTNPILVIIAWYIGIQSDYDLYFFVKYLFKRKVDYESFKEESGL